MCRLLCIKDANTPFKKVGDIVGVYDDSQQWFGNELVDFTIIDFPGIDRLEFKKLVYPYRKRVFRMPTGDTWSFEQPELKEVWEDRDGKYYFLEQHSKFPVNILDLSATDRDALAKNPPIETIKIILEQLAYRNKDYPANLTECADLNGARIG